MRNLFLIFLFLFFLNNAYPQEGNKKIYFLADTINISKENKFMQMDWSGAFEQFFVFFCKCSPPYKSYVTFSYINKKGNKKAEIIAEKPNFPYISFKELMDMSGKYYNAFDNYDLYITEVLPGNKYRTNQVYFVPYRPPSQDGVIVKEKH